MLEKICLPITIIRDKKLSPRARIVWAELSVLPQDEKNQFVVQTKELAKTLGVCGSTLRRAVKILQEHKLIECVGKTKIRHKVYKFVEEIKEERKEREEPKEEIKEEPREEPKEEREEIREEIREEREIGPVETLMPAKIAAEEKAKADAAAVKPELMRICYKSTRPLNAADIERLKHAEEMGSLYKRFLREEYPALNGRNNKPLIDEDFMYYFALRFDKLLGFDWIAAIRRCCDEFVAKPFVAADDMIVYWRD